MLEGITILDVVNTGALGMMFFLVLRQQQQLQNMQDRVMGLVDKLIEKVQLMEKYGILPPDKE